MRQIDRSPRIARLLVRFSSSLARRRGLLPLLGVLLIAFSFVFSLLGYAVPSPVLSLLWSITHHTGLLLAFIGLLLIEPLGR
jgi:hypothetical protein